jgi:hypothetical protein
MSFAFSSGVRLEWPFSPSSRCPNGRTQGMYSFPSRDARPTLRVGDRKPRSTPTTCGVQAVGETPKIASTRPHLLGLAVLAVVQLAIGACHGAAGNGHRLAAAGLQVVLALEVPKRQVRTARISRDIRELIGLMSRENPGWGAPRICSELLLLGHEVAEWTVAKYMIRTRNP